MLKDNIFFVLGFFSGFIYLKTIFVLEVVWENPQKNESKLRNVIRELFPLIMF